MDGILYMESYEDTKHSVNRAKERVGLNERRARKMMNLARERGIRSNECHWQADKRFLECRTNEDAEAVAYNGFCFILDRETHYCITVFPLPKDFGKKKTCFRNVTDRYSQKYNNACCY